MPNDPSSVQQEGHADGRSQIRLVRVTQHETRQDFEEWTVAVELTDASRSTSPGLDAAGESAALTFENTVFALAQQSNADSIEEFAGELTQVLLSQNPDSTAVEVSIASHLWKRLTIAGEPHPAAFMKGSDERQTTRVARSREGSVTITSGFREMTLIRASASNAASRVAATADLRNIPGEPFSLTITAEWQYNAESVSATLDFHKLRQRVRERMIAAFASLDSFNLQQTLEALAEAAMQQPSQVIDEIVLRATDRPLLPVAFSAVQRGDSHQVFVQNEADAGTIEVSRRRAQPSLKPDA